MIATFALYLLTGRAVVWAISIARPTQWLWQLFDGCEFCLGVWVYSVLSAIFKAPNEAQPISHQALPARYVVGMSELVIGILTSAAMYIFALGWRDRFHALHD